MATLTIISICVVVFVVQSLLPSTVALGSACTEFLRTVGLSNGLSDVLGHVPLCVKDEPWRALTSATLHSGILHLAMNMFALWVVGSFLEQALGRWRLVAIFVLSAVAGSVAVDAWARLGSDPVAMVVPTVGASGGVFGLFGAMVWVARRIGADITGILSVIAINVVFSFVVPNVSWQGHLGGLLMGFALGAVYALAPRLKRTIFGVAGTSAGAVLLVAVQLWLRSRPTILD